MNFIIPLYYIKASDKSTNVKIITILVIEKKVELFQLLVEFSVQGAREAFFHELASEKKVPQ